MGGLARATSDAALVLDAAGKSLVIIETVGVGQDEVDIVRTADISIVVLVPGTGDDVQALKAGIMEIADIYVVNKCDRDGADRMVTSIESNLALQHFGEGQWRPPIVKTEATTGKGIPELWQTVGAFRTHSEGTRAKRLKARNEFRLRDLLTHRFMEHVEHHAARPAASSRRWSSASPGARSIPTPRRRIFLHGPQAGGPQAGSREPDNESRSRSRRHRGQRSAGVTGVLPGRARPARRGQRGDRVAARPRDLHQHRAVDLRNARGDRRRFADREVSREARARHASRRAAGRRHRGGAGAPARARHPADRRAGAGPAPRARWWRSSTRRRRTACWSS